MQQQKLQEERKQGQDVNVVHLQEKLQGEELPEEEEDARTSYSFFYSNTSIFRYLIFALHLTK